ncbi:site-specific integrase [Iodobacter sp. CM08]|uniref:site-specific integrase n=1 Tax=Iodobacter sp. CM08 TaxID=3085902 RepID=UPI002980C551|nr:site-specific integrase [Iodobacter sp. CM08]MDW5417829.1 site-specific integrase [Iodobacter sp. CM08]
MAGKRKRNNSWEYAVRCKKLLPKPLTFTFSDEAEGDAYIAKLEALLERGILPQELAEHGMNLLTVRDAIRAYQKAIAVPDTDIRLLNRLESITDGIGATRLTSIDYPWAERWISQMKQEKALSPVTIRHYVGALARCFDWMTRRHYASLAVNPLRSLPKSYAKYNDDDANAVEMQGIAVPIAEERDRRPSAKELALCQAILNKEKPASKERPLALTWQAALECIFELAPETAMRLSEMFTLEYAQIDLPQRTIFLDKTKNGDKRQVPLSSTAKEILNRYIHLVKTGERGMEGFQFTAGAFFPWPSATALERRKTTAKLSAQFARVFAAAGCPDLHFHDLRHEGTCRFYERTTLSDIQIAKITGHKDLRMLKRYANLRASDLAEKLW